VLLLLLLPMLCWACCVQFLLKLPVQPDVAAAQRAVYPGMQGQQQPDDSSSSDEDSDSDSDPAPAAAAGGSGKKRATPAKDDAADDSSSDDDEGQPFSDDEETNAAAAMEVDGDSSEGWDDDDGDKPTKKQQQNAAKQSAAKQNAAQQNAATAAMQQAGLMESGGWLAPPRPMRELVGGCLGWSEQQQLAALGSNKQLQRRMTNVAQLVRIDWGDVCARVSGLRLSLRLLLTEITRWRALCSRHMLCIVGPADLHLSRLRLCAFCRWMLMHVLLLLSKPAEQTAILQCCCCRYCYRCCCCCCRTSVGHGCHERLPD
jgi:hypothetical protein